VGSQARHVCKLPGLLFRKEGSFWRCSDCGAGYKVTVTDAKGKFKVWRNTKPSARYKD
jgi:hypothetical protein